jgi:hypothetical protein
MTTEERTLYVLVDYTDEKGAEHKRGDSVTFATGDKEGSELLFRGVLSTRPVRRSAGESKA